MSFVDAINAFEVVWWIGCGAVVGTMSLRSGKRSLWRGMVAAITLVLFGLSDWVELQTGAWWRPWWLAVWKGLCIAVLVACVVLHVREKSRRTSKETDLHGE